MSIKRIDIATTVEGITNVTNQRTLVNLAIQISLDRVYQYHDWPYYLDSKHGVISTISDYKTGTIAIILGSQTATITTGVVSATFVGRKLRVGSDKPYYRITAVNVGLNTLTLDIPFQSTTVTAATYEIFKDEYLLRSDVDKYKILRQLQNGIPILDMTPTVFDKAIPTPQNFSDPVYSIMSGSTNGSSYTTGTIAAVINTSIITGAATSWLSVEGLGRLAKIRVGSSVYTILSVDSDTQITVYDVLPAISAGTTYEIKLNNLIVQLYYLPNAARNILYRYFRIPDPLINDYDLPDMPYEFHWILIEGALSWIWRQKGDLNKGQVDAEQRFILGLEQMKQKIGTFAPDRITSRRSIDKIRRVRFEGVEGANFDWKYSAF